MPKIVSTLRCFVHCRNRTSHSLTYALVCDWANPRTLYPPALAVDVEGHENVSQGPDVREAVFDIIQNSSRRALGLARDYSVGRYAHCAVEEGYRREALAIAA